MIRSLRRRFILGAMLAFLILLILLVGGIAAAGYYQMESSADALLFLSTLSTIISNSRSPLMRANHPKIIKSATISTVPFR